MIRRKIILTRIKVAFVASAGLILSACAGSGLLGSLSDSKLNDEWKGHPITDAMGKWGKPILVKPDGDGTNLYEWAWSKGYTYQAYTGSDTQRIEDRAVYHGDGRITYEPDYQTTDHYETRVGSRGCMLMVHADSSGIITNLGTQDYSGGCSDFYSSANASPPDEESARKGEDFSNRFQTIKSITARYKAICTNPEYTALFEKSPCTNTYLKIVGAPNASKMTSKQKETLAKWRAEMEAIVSDYLAFFKSSGDVSDKAIAHSVESIQTSVKTRSPNNVFLFSEQMTAMNAYQLAQYTKQIYQKYFN